MHFTMLLKVALTFYIITQYYFTFQWKMKKINIFSELSKMFRNFQNFVNDESDK